MRNIDQTIKEHLKEASITMSIFVLIETKNGDRIRFNSSNRDVYTYHDIDYDLNPQGPKKVVYKGGGYTPSIFSTDESNSVQKMDLKGMLSSIHEEDRQNAFIYEYAVNNYYQGANVFISIANYLEPNINRYQQDPMYYESIENIKIARANIGGVSIKDFDNIEIELRGFNQKLNNNINYSYSRTCRAKLFDGACGLNRNNFVSLSTVYGVIDNLTILINKVNAPASDFKNGYLLLTSGKAKAQKANIRNCKTVIYEGVELYEVEFIRSVPSEIMEGDSLNIYPGCDKTIANCKKFNNIENFRGEPYIPGEEVFNIQGVGR